MDRESIAVHVRAAVDGDAAAWKGLVEGLSPLVWSVIRAHRMPEADGHEVFQTVWFRLAQHLRRIREPEKAGSWLATTARNECLKVLRSASQLTVTSDPNLLDRPSPEPTPEQAVLDAEAEASASAQIRAVWAAFQGLSDNCRRLLRLLMTTPPTSYQEVSAALGIAVGSIGPIRQRCLGRLRAALGEQVNS